MILVDVLLSVCISYQAMAGLKTLEGGMNPKRLSFLDKRQSYLKFQKYVAMETSPEFHKIQQKVDEYQGADLATSCSKLVKQGQLFLWNDKFRKKTDRYVYCFDSLVLFVKEVRGETDRESV